MINEVGINDKCGGYLRLIPLVLLLVPPTLLLVPPGGTNIFPCSKSASSSTDFIYKGSNNTGKSWYHQGGTNKYPHAQISVLT